MIYKLFQKTSFNSFLYFLLLISAINILEVDIELKGIFFIIISMTLIYLKKNIFIKLSSLIIIILLTLVFFINNTSKIIEKGSMLKISEKNNSLYENLFGVQIYKIVKQYYINNYKDCYFNPNICFEETTFIENHISPDQKIWGMDKKISRKVNNINFKSISDLRPAFINDYRSKLNRTQVTFEKKLIPFYINYKFDKKIGKICYKGLIFTKSDIIKKYYQTKLDCFEPDKEVNEIYAFQVDGDELSLEINNLSGIEKYSNYIIFFIIFIYFISNINLRNNKDNLKLFIPVLISTIIIFKISSFNGWFNFNLFSFYFYPFEGGDGLTNMNYMYEIFISLVNFNLVDILKGAEDVFFFAPGLRYLLLVEKILFGDFYYLIFFIVFISPLIFYKLINLFFNKKISYILFISFLIFPFLHHIGISYFQYIRHTYRILSEPIGYIFFFYALIGLLKNNQDNKLKINLMFFISVLFRPSLLLTVFIITSINFLKDISKNLSLNILLLYSFILLLYLLPLIHNIYFGNQFILWASYANDVISFEHISNQNINFYYIRLFNFTTLFFIVILFIPSKFNFLKIIIISQYITLFYFDLNSRYYWVFWTLISLILGQYVLKKIPVLKNYNNN